MNGQPIEQMEPSTFLGCKLICGAGDTDFNILGFGYA
jgi:hypothetical protein